jgi:iron complex transport system substrate-binding protein
LIQNCFIAFLLTLAVPCGLRADDHYGMEKTATVPERIISLGQTITERIYLLGADTNLIANTVYCVQPEDAKQKEKVGTLIQANLEKIVALKPDLVIATNMARPKQLRKLKDLGIRVVQFSYPKNFSEMCLQFLELGELLGKEDRQRRSLTTRKRKLQRSGQKQAVCPRKGFSSSSGSSRFMR